MIPLSDVGWKAAAALRASGGRTRVLAALSESIYLTAGDVIVWLGRAGATLHPRAMLTSAPLPAPAPAFHLDAGGARPWTPAPVMPAPSSAGALAAGCRALAARLSALGPPDGLGALLAGAAPLFPLDTAAPRARAFARACAADDARAALEAATALLGLGPGLTPSGDDFVGAAFFARRLLAAAGDAAPGAWARAAGDVAARAAARTHPISAALLGDMLEGHGHAPLHDLARALAQGAPTEAALAAARRLVRIGHSSGWDMLAGFMAALPENPLGV